MVPTAPFQLLQNNRAMDLSESFHVIWGVREINPSHSAGMTDLLGVIPSETRSFFR
jgi:hypothetical protein